VPRVAGQVLHKATDPILKWRPVLFGPADERPYRRLVSDAVRLAAAVIVMWILVRWVDPNGPVQTAIVSFVKTVSPGAQSLAKFLYVVGLGWAVGLIVVPLFTRRFLLAGRFFLTGAIAWFVAALFAAGESTTQSLGDVLSASFSWEIYDAAFPTIRLAAAIAVMSAAAPFISRPTRRVSLVASLTMMVATVYVPISLPYAALGGAALGWGIAAAIHLVLGSPGGAPSRDQLSGTLRELGVDVGDIELAPIQTGGAKRYTAIDSDGTINVRVLGRDQRDAQLLSRAWRTVVFRSSPGRYFPSRLADVEHEALTVLLAGRAGVRTPELVVTGTAGPGMAVYSERAVEGTPLDQLEADAITDDVLDDLWDQVGRLHDGNVVHLDLAPANLVSGADGIVITGFTSAVATDVQHASLNDVATVLAGTAALVGTDRAVAAARRQLGDDRLAETLPSIQSALLPSSLRASGHAERKRQSKQLGELRDTAATALGVDPPQLTQLHRVSGTTLAMVIGIFVALAAIMSQVGSPEELWDTITSASWEWMLLGLVVSMCVSFPAALALMGSVLHPLPLGRTSELQLSVRFINLAAPTIGGLATQIRYLQKQGVDLASAVAAGGVVSGVANVVVTGIVCIISLILSPAQVDLSDVSASGVLTVLLIAVLIIAVVCGIVFGIPRIRNKVLEPLKQGWAAISGIARSPKRVVQLTVGWAGSAVFFGAILWCCVMAFGATSNIWTILLINTGVSVLAFAVPIPGGAAAVGTVGVAGALTATGVPNEAAVAASLLYQVLASFFPAAPGWFAMRNLLADDYL